jgi:hypothetical protein
MIGGIIRHGGPNHSTLGGVLWLNHPTRYSGSSFNQNSRAV